MTCWPHSCNVSWAHLPHHEGRLVNTTSLNLTAKMQHGPSCDGFCSGSTRTTAFSMLLTSPIRKDDHRIWKMWPGGSGLRWPTYCWSSWMRDCTKVFNCWRFSLISTASGLVFLNCDHKKNIWILSLNLSIRLHRLLSGKEQYCTVAKWSRKQKEREPAWVQLSL